MSSHTSQLGLGGDPSELPFAHARVIAGCVLFTVWY